MRNNGLRAACVAGLTALVLSSCLKEENQRTTPEWQKKNCQIASFSLKNDSIKGLSQVVFTIDQLKGEIYNTDSMPYGTKIDRKVLIQIAYDGAVGPSSVEFQQEATGKRTSWRSTDSVDFSRPVRIYITSYDRTQAKTYIARLNIHQQDPDSMAWLHSYPLLGHGSITDESLLADAGTYLLLARTADALRIYRTSDAQDWRWTLLTPSGLPAGKTLDAARATLFRHTYYIYSTDGALYRSADGAAWTTVAGAPTIVSLLGAVDTVAHTTRTVALAAIIRQGDALHFASMDAAGKWTTGEAVPATFPTEGFGSTNYEAAHRRHLLLVGGRRRDGSLTNQAWETTDGHTWVCLNENIASGLPALEGAAVAMYDGKIYLMGGINASGAASRTLYLSTDRGATWTAAAHKLLPPDEFAARGYASAVTTPDGYLILIGGRTSRTGFMMDELWRGRINRLGYGR